MTDPRLLASNGRVAAMALKGQVAADRFVEGELRQIVRPVVSIWRDRVGGPRQRQLLYGARFRVLEDDGSRAFGRAEQGGYVGYVASSDLVAPVQANHVVSALATHLYSAPDLKSPEVAGLSFGSRVRLVGRSGRFAQTDTGAFVPEQHVRPVGEAATDYAAIAEIFLGVPYLWGGDSCWGIDCSGLVTAALVACGIDCPGDSDLQQAAVGQVLDDAEPTRRGDLFFWRTHVAMAVDGETLIHANANDMAVAHEPIDAAVARIAGQGEGSVTARKRL
jgi:cell wall-associated NlpC family hydrolase